MYKYAILFVFFLLTAAPLIGAGAQTPARILKPAENLEESYPLSPPNLTGEVLKVSGEFRLRIINNDSTRKFQGLATISLGTPSQQFEAVKVKISLAPGESAIHLLYSMPAMGEQYTLLVTDVAGNVVIHKIAPVKSSTDPALSAPPPPPISTVPIKSEVQSQLRVKARLAGGANEHDPYFIAFELSNPTTITNAMLYVKAKGLNEQRPVTFSGSTNIEIKVSDEMEVQTINYKVIGSLGEVLATGDLDIAQLMLADVVNIVAMKLDKPAYRSGESAKLTIELSGNTPNGVRVEIVAKDGAGKVLFRDARKEKRETGLPAFEFTIPIAREIKETILLEIKVFDSDSNTLLDSNNKDLPVGGN